MRHPPLLALVLPMLAGCNDRARELAVAHAELGGVTLTVRRHEEHFKRRCTEEGFNLYKCLLIKAETHGCVYLDLGEPLPMPGPRDSPCTYQSPTHAVLVGAPVPVDFETDPPGARFAVRFSDHWSTGYVVDQELLVPPTPYVDPRTARPKDTSAIDWRAMPTLEEQAPQVYFNARTLVQPTLLKLMREHGGDATVVKMLIGTTGAIDSPGWEPAWQSLTRDVSRRKVAAGVFQAMLDVPTEEALNWFDAHPEMMPEGFEDQVRALALGAASDVQFTLPQRWLARAWQRKDPAASTVACAILEQLELWRLWGENNLGEQLGEPPNALPYAVIAATHSRCAAVTRSYGDAPCSSDLRCTHSAPVADGGEPEQRVELCDATDLANLKTALETGKTADDDNFEAAAKLHALLAQGPLSETFVLRDARRSYRQVGGVTTTPSNQTPCEADPDRVSDFLCGLRPEQTHLDLYGCRVDIDDANKVVRLWRDDAQDGGP